MDEPTSSLTQRETDRLYEVIDDLKAAGVSVLYISHRLAEVKRVADRVTVLRDGKNAGELPQDEITHDAMVRLMVGRDLKQFYPQVHRTRRRRRAGARRSATSATAAGRRTPVSFDVRAGEIVGMAGLVGAGRTELAEALFGIRPLTGGRSRARRPAAPRPQPGGRHRRRRRARPRGPPAARPGPARGASGST